MMKNNKIRNSKSSALESGLCASPRRKYGGSSKKQSGSSADRETGFTFYCCEVKIQNPQNKQQLLSISADLSVKQSLFSPDELGQAWNSIKTVTAAKSGNILAQLEAAGAEATTATSLYDITPSFVQEQEQNVAKSQEWLQHFGKFQDFQQKWQKFLVRNDVLESENMDWP